MSSIEVDIEDEYSLPDTVTVAYASRTFTISGTRYVCTVLAEEMGPTDNRFYPAAILGSVLYVCPTYGCFSFSKNFLRNFQKSCDLRRKNRTYGMKGTIRP